MAGKWSQASAGETLRLERNDPPEDRTDEYEPGRIDAKTEEYEGADESERQAAPA